MDAIKNILAEFYWIFLIVGIITLIGLISFILSTKKKKSIKEELTPTQTTPEESILNIPDEPKQPEMILDLTETANAQMYSEPSLDGLASNATEVKLGFDTIQPEQTIFENNDPMLVISDASNMQQNVLEQPIGLVIEEPSQGQLNTVTTETQTIPEQGFGLVIEDNTAPVEQVLQPSVVNQPEAIVQQQVEPQLVIQDISAIPAQMPVQNVPIQEQPVMPEVMNDAPTLVIPDPSENQQQM